MFTHFCRIVVLFIFMSMVVQHRQARIMASALVD